MTDARQPPARVLIIDDDATALELFEEMLVERGYVVRAVLTVEAGLTEAAIHAHRTGQGLPAANRRRSPAP